MTSQLNEVERFGTVPPASMLRIANSWQAVGKVNQATDAYVRLLARYPGSPEARYAVEKILSVAESYERQGRYHLALDLYEKLGRLS